MSLITDDKKFIGNYSLIIIDVLNFLLINIVI